MIDNNAQETMYLHPVVRVRAFPAARVGCRETAGFLVREPQEGGAQNDQQAQDQRDMGVGDRVLARFRGVRLIQHVQQVNASEGRYQRQLDAQKDHPQFRRVIHLPKRKTHIQASGDQDQRQEDSGHPVVTVSNVLEKDLRGFLRELSPERRSEGHHDESQAADPDHDRYQMHPVVE